VHERNIVHMTINYETQGSRIPEFSIGDRLRKAREDTGLTQGAFANEFGVTTRTIGRLEAATDRGTLKRALLLAYAMRTSVPLEWIETGECTPRDLNPEPTDYSSAAYDHPVVLLLAS
jgi:transcriptional regulator with XRE-family HTH domain